VTAIYLLLRQETLVIEQVFLALAPHYLVKPKKVTSHRSTSTSTALLFFQAVKIVTAHLFVSTTDLLLLLLEEVAQVVRQQ
jgi:hypothetical protein